MVKEKVSNIKINNGKTGQQSERKNKEMKWPLWIFLTTIFSVLAVVFSIFFWDEKGILIQIYVLPISVNGIICNIRNLKTYIEWDNVKKDYFIDRKKFILTENFIVVVCSVVSIVGLLAIYCIVPYIESAITGARFVYLCTIISVIIVWVMNDYFLKIILKNKSNSSDENGFSKCSKDYIDIKKNQYMSVAYSVKRVIELTGLDENEGTFELAKEMIINNEGLRKKELFKTLLSSVIDIILIYLRNIFTAVLAVLTALFSVDKEGNMESFKLIIVLAFILGGFEVISRLRNNKLEKLNVRMLKSMDYKQYESLTK